MTEDKTYKGFIYKPDGRSFRNGKHIFRNQLFDTFEQFCSFVDASLEMTNYQQHQLNKYGNVLPEPEELENGTEEAERFAGWVHDQSEQQLLHHENEY